MAKIIPDFHIPERITTAEELLEVEFGIHINGYPPDMDAICSHEIDHINPICGKFSRIFHI